MPGAPVVPAMDSATEEQLRHACAELEQRLRAGEECQAEHYLSGLPHLAANVDQAADLIYTEFLTRLELGQQDLAARFYARFPAWKDYLQQQFAVHDWLRQSVPPAAPLPMPESSATWQPHRAVAAPPAAAASTVAMPAQYEVLGEIARGGMGVVYKARQPGLNRLVALKMLKSDGSLTGDALARFHAEAEIIARLQHPNIVHIYEIGTTQGSPFLALEYVAGGSLAQRLFYGPLPPIDAARLLAAVAQAVQAAHAQGILHRDIKPGNILLQGQSEDPSPAREDLAPVSLFTPKLTDFGLAKRLNEVGPHTRTGAVVGTPAYMAPEQITGQRQAVGPVTDVYALGVVLYECLTGRPPFQAAQLLDLFEDIRAREPVLPTRLQPKIPKDLETICLKCLRKEPAARYASAAALADDLERFQRGEPILARPVGTVERAWRWCRRNPVVAGLLGLLLVSLVTGTVVSTAFWWQADQRLGDLQQEYTRAEENLRLAQERQERAVHHFREMLGTVYDFHLTVSQSPELDRPGLVTLRKDLLQRVLVFLDGVLQEPGQEATLRMQRAQTQKARGEVLLMLGKLAEAEAAYTEAIALLRALVPLKPQDPGPRHWLAGCLSLLGDLLAQRGRAQEAVPHLQAALAEFATLRQMKPDDEPLRINQGKTLFNLAQAYQRLQQYGPAEQALREGLALLEPLGKSPDAAASVLGELGRGSASMGALLMERNQAAAAQAWLERARDLYDQARQKRPGSTRFDRDLARMHNNLGSNLRRLRKPTESRAAFQKAEELLRKLIAENPGVPDYRIGLSFACQQLGHDLAAQGQRAAGLRKLEESVAVLEQGTKEQPLATPERTQLCNAQAALAILLREDGRPADALPPSRRAVELCQELLAEQPRHPPYLHQLGGHWSNLGLVHLALQQWDEACTACQKAIDYQRQALAALPHVHQVRFFLSTHLLNLSEGERGRQRIDAALAAVREFQKLWPSDGTKYVDAARQYAKCYAAVGRATSQPEDEAHRERCAQEVVAALREALRLGFRDLRELRTDKLYDPLRQRPDFQAVLQELEAKLKDTPAPEKATPPSGMKP